MKISFDNSNPVFFQTLKKAVDEYFITNSLKKTGNWRLYHKAVILILRQQYFIFSSCLVRTAFLRVWSFLFWWGLH